MNVQDTVDELKQSLDSTVSEEKLLDTLNSRLAVLREDYPSNKHLFTQEHIGFLRQLNVLSEQLRLFIELKEDLSDVEDVQTYTRLMKQLTALEKRFGGLAVCRRVSKEIRELNEKLPHIQHQKRIKDNAKITGRIYELERNSKLCPKGHKMLVRKSKNGYFWGCSKYPVCQFRKPLSAKDRDRLSDA